MMPPDIEQKIKQVFATEKDREKVKTQILSLWSMSLNVGADQLARSILVLSDGKTENIQTIFERNFYGDPRDVIMMAEAKWGHPGHYFNKPFDK